MYILGHGLRLTAVPRSTQPCVPSGSLNRVPAAVRFEPWLSDSDIAVGRADQERQEDFC